MEMPPADDRRTFSKGLPVHRLQDQYTKFVENGGGVPILLPISEDIEFTGDLVSKFDGLIITGGVDVDPSLYGQENTDSKNCNLRRDKFEIALMKEAIKRKTPLLGICRGMQLMNVLYGGSLHQEIRVNVQNSRKHTRNKDWSETVHPVELQGGSILEKIFSGGQGQVNSSHHQAVAVEGEGLTIFGRSDDGVIETIGVKGNPRILGVQWHPERMSEDETQLRLIKWFVAEAG